MTTIQAVVCSNRVSMSKLKCAISLPSPLFHNFQLCVCLCLCVKQSKKQSVMLASRANLWTTEEAESKRGNMGQGKGTQTNSERLSNSTLVESEGKRRGPYKAVRVLKKCTHHHQVKSSSSS